MIFGVAFISLLFTSHISVSSGNRSVTLKAVTTSGERPSPIFVPSMNLPSIAMCRLFAPSCSDTYFRDNVETKEAKVMSSIPPSILQSVGSDGHPLARMPRWSCK